MAPSSEKTDPATPLESPAVSPIRERDTHNASPQVGVARNPDPALDLAHEHKHEHTHHGKTALNGHDDVMYSRSPEIFEKTDVVGPSAPDYEARKTHDKTLETSLSNEESGRVGSVKEGQRKWTVRYIYRRFKIVFHFAFWAVWTAWWIYGLYFHRSDGLGWLKPFLLWLAITLRIITLWVPARYAMIPLRFAWKYTAHQVYEATPKKLRKPAAAAVTVAVFLVGSLVPEENADNTRANRVVSLFGLVVMIVLLYLTSRARSKIPWHTVIGGMLTQFIIAVFVLRTHAGFDIFNFISFLAQTLLGFANEGTIFLTNPTVPELHWFLTGVVPPIIFFVALVQLLYHVGFLQWFIGKFAIFFF